MLPIKHWPAAAWGWLLAFTAPRYAAALADYRRSQAIVEHGQSLQAWQQERRRYEDEYREQNGKRLDAEAQAASLRDQLTERTQQRDLAIAQNEVLQHRLEMLIKWQEAELQRLETEAQIHAMRRGLPPERDHDEPLH